MSDVWAIRVRLAVVALCSLAGAACCLKASSMAEAGGSVWPPLAGVGLAGAIIVMGTCLAGFASTFEPEEQVVEADDDELDRGGDDWWKHGPSEADREE